MTADVSRWVKHYRQLRGLTQKRLAQKCGLNQSYISKLESDDTGITVRVLQVLSDTLNVPLEALVYGPLELRMQDDTHQQKYDEGYRKALQDVLAFCEYRFTTILQTIHKAKSRRAFLNILRRLAHDPEARKLFSELNGKVVVRVTGTGDVDEIC